MKNIFPLYLTPILSERVIISKMPPSKKLNGESYEGGEDYGNQTSERRIIGKQENPETEEQVDIGNQELSKEEEEVLSSEIENLYFSPTSSPISSPPHPQLFRQFLEKEKDFVQYLNCTS